MRCCDRVCAGLDRVSTVKSSAALVPGAPSLASLLAVILRMALSGVYVCSSRAYIHKLAFPIFSSDAALEGLVYNSCVYISIL